MVQNRNFNQSSREIRFRWQVLPKIVDLRTELAALHRSRLTPIDSNQMSNSAATPRGRMGSLHLREYGNSLSMVDLDEQHRANRHNLNQGTPLGYS
jgi:hypothetical protein